VYSKAGQPSIAQGARSPVLAPFRCSVRDYRPYFRIARPRRYCDAFKASIAKLVTAHTDTPFNLRNWYIAQDNAGAISARARNGGQYQIGGYWHAKKAVGTALPERPRQFSSAHCLLGNYNKLMKLLPLHEIRVLKCRCAMKTYSIDSARHELSIGERAVR
jgi:hypothetical protein